MCQVDPHSKKWIRVMPPSPPPSNRRPQLLFHKVIEKAKKAHEKWQMKVAFSVIAKQNYFTSYISTGFLKSWETWKSHDIETKDCLKKLKIFKIHGKVLEAPSAYLNFMLDVLRIIIGIFHMVLEKSLKSQRKLMKSEPCLPDKNLCSYNNVM